MNTSTSQPTAAPTLPRSAPEAQGIDSGAIRAYVTAADQQVNSMHSFILVRHGHVVAEGWWKPYAPESPHVLFSLSKSFTSTAIGLAIAEGLLSVDDEVLKFFPEDAPDEPTDKLKAMRVRDLLCMSTGHEKEPSLSSQQEPWTTAFLAWPVPHKPGTHFLYNSAATYMQSAIVQKITGQTVLDYLRPRLFEPLGIENPTWGTSPQGISFGGWGLNIRTEDIARFGQLYLQKGQWNGQQLVPATWIEAATSRQVSNGSNPQSDWEQGYGYQFWRCRHGAYRGDGMYGQFCVVLPEQDAVVAITAGTGDLQGVLNVVWDHLLPAMQPTSLPANEAAHHQLQATLASLTMPLPEGSATSSAAAGMGQEFHFPANEQKLESVKLEANPDSNATVLTLRVDGTEQHIPCGYRSWQKSRVSYGSFTDQPVAAGGAWTADGAYTARLCLYETATSIMLTLRGGEDTLNVDVTYQPGGGPAHQLTGKRP
ncbi:MAG: serine hydrolase [Abitibacteriaceae bacterium]|nr:serine hydrolase [Abditibacteriaceae bacterium]